MDEHYPGWRNTVNGTHLDIFSCDWCVLGQASGMHYNKAYEKHGLSKDQARRLGFSEGDEGIGYGHDLEEAWRQELA